MLYSKLTVWLCLVGCLMAAITSCTHNLKEKQLAQPGATTNLLIAGDASEFKDNIRNAIISRYKSRCNIEIINIDKLPKAIATDYDAVLIMDTCLAWSHFNNSVKTFLDKSHNQNVVFFMTVDDEDWSFTYNGVDAITSASEIENESSMTSKLTSAIDNILGFSSN